MGGVGGGQYRPLKQISQSYESVSVTVLYNQFQLLYNQFQLL